MFAGLPYYFPQLTLKIFIPLLKYISFSTYFCEKIILIDNIPVFLQASIVVFSVPHDQA